MRLLMMVTALSLLLTAACSNNDRPNHAVSVVFTGEDCVKRRFTQVNGEGINVLTQEPDGGLTPVAYFDTWAAARKAYPDASKALNCPPEATVTLDDVKRQYPFPELMGDGGSGTGK